MHKLPIFILISIGVPLYNETLPPKKPPLFCIFSTAFIVLDEPIEEAELKAVDDFLWNIPVNIIDEFLKLICSKLDMVVKGKRPNWRHDLVVAKKPTFIDGKRLLSHQLSVINVCH